MVRNRRAKFPDARTGPLDVAAESRRPALLPGLGLEQASDLAAAFKALADPTRVQIVSLLLGAGDEGLCVCDITANFPLGQPTISHHLKLLRDSGLLLARRCGLWVFYAVNRERLARLGIVLPVPQGPIVRSECPDEGPPTMR